MRSRPWIALALFALIALVAHAENHLVVWIVLAAITGQIFVGFRIEPTKRLEVADWGREGGIPR